MTSIAIVGEGEKIMAELSAIADGGIYLAVLAVLGVVGLVGLTVGIIRSFRK